MSKQPEALRLAELWEKHSHGYARTPEAMTAAELRRLSAENERLHQINQSHEMKLSVRGYEIQIADLEAQRDALFEVLKSALRHAEWRDKIIYPSGGEEFQNWMISIYLPVPLSASDKSPETALDRFVADAIKTVEGEKE